jgi:hypothetical protein
MSKKGNVVVVNPVTSINPNQLRDDVIETALANGFTREDVERLERQDAYRKAYNSRPEVVEKRKLYTHKRYLHMKALRALLKG